MLEMCHFTGFMREFLGMVGQIFYGPFYPSASPNPLTQFSKEDKNMGAKFLQKALKNLLKNHQFFTKQKCPKIWVLPHKNEG